MGQLLLAPRLCPAPASIRRSEYQRNKDVVIGMLLQVSLNIDNPFGGDGK